MSCTQLRQAFPVHVRSGGTRTPLSVRKCLSIPARQAGQAIQWPIALALLKNNPRKTAVLKTGASKKHSGATKEASCKGWPRRSRASSFGSTVLKLSSLCDGDPFQSGTCRRLQLICVAVNPDIVRAQVEGGIAYGLSPHSEE